MLTDSRTKRWTVVFDQCAFKAYGFIYVRIKPDECFLGRRSLMNQRESGEVEKIFINYLSDRNSRAEIELALAVHLLLENPDEDRCRVYELAMTAWEHMCERAPEMGVVEKAQTASPHALVTLFFPDGVRIPMKIEICARKVRLRSMSGTPRKRRAAEESWKSKSFKGAFMSKVADRHRAGNRRAATIQE